MAHRRSVIAAEYEDDENEQDAGMPLSKLCGKSASTRKLPLQFGLTLPVQQAFAMENFLSCDLAFFPLERMEAIISLFDLIILAWLSLHHILWHRRGGGR